MSHDNCRKTAKYRNLYIKTSTCCSLINKAQRFLPHLLRQANICPHLSFHLFVLSGLSTGTLKYIVSLKSYVCPPKILKIFLRFYFAKNDIWQLYADVIFAFYNYYLLFFYSPDIYSLYKIFLAEWINDHKRQNCYDDCCIFYCIFRSSFYRRRQITSHDQCPQFHLEVI